MNDDPYLEKYRSDEEGGMKKKVHSVCMHASRLGKRGMGMICGTRLGGFHLIYFGKEKRNCTCG